MSTRAKARPALDGLIRGLYGSLSEEVHFANSLHSLGKAFRSHLTGLHAEDFGAHRGRVTLVGDISASEYLDFNESYSNRWNGQNLWMERSLDGFLTQGYQHGEAVVSDRELRESPYYRHALKPIDIRYGLGIQIWRNDHLDLAVASFHRGHGDRGFDADDFALVNQVRPHLVNAYAIYRRLARLEDATASLRTAFDRAPLGMLVLDVDGRVLESNAAAEKWLPLAGVARSKRDGRLGFAATRLQQRYDEAVKMLAGALVAPPHSLPLDAVDPSQASRTGRFVLHLCAVPLGAVSGARPGARILGFIAELQPEQADALAENILRQVLGFTSTEARVVLALRRQSDVAAAAQALGLQPTTVRSHLRSIHARLGIGRTAELLLLIERLIGSVPRT